MNSLSCKTMVGWASTVPVRANRGGVVPDRPVGGKVGLSWTVHVSQPNHLRLCMKPVHMIVRSRQCGRSSVKICFTLYLLAI